MTCCQLKFSAAKTCPLPGAAAPPAVDTIARIVAETGRIHPASTHARMLGHHKPSRHAASILAAELAAFLFEIREC